MDERLFPGSLRVAGQVHADDAERHAKRQDPEAVRRHPEHRHGRILEEQAGQERRESDDQRVDREHERDEAAEHHPDDVGQGLTVLLPDADADEEAGNGDHTGWDRPEETHEIIGGGESGNADGADKDLQEMVDGKAAERLVEVRGGPREADFDERSAFPEIHVPEREPHE